MNNKVVRKSTSEVKRNGKDVIRLLDTLDTKKLLNELAEISKKVDEDHAALYLYSSKIQEELNFIGRNNLTQNYYAASDIPAGIRFFYQ